MRTFDESWETTSAGIVAARLGERAAFWLVMNRRPAKFLGHLRRVTRGLHRRSS
jgi:hypothetical protein